MKHTSWVERGETFQTEADYVVVGSGAGGSVAAAELARGGAEVVLVEAGPWRRPGLAGSGACRRRTFQWKC